MYVDFKLTMMDILSDTEIFFSSDISATEESASSEEDVKNIEDSTTLDDTSVKIPTSVNVSAETLVDESGSSSDETLIHIDSTLTAILIVILLIWASNHLHIVAKSFGKIGKGE